MRVLFLRNTTIDRDEAGGLGRLRSADQPATHPNQLQGFFLTAAAPVQRAHNPVGSGLSIDTTTTTTIAIAIVGRAGRASA